jgi:hypothetical protein
MKRNIVILFVIAIGAMLSGCSAKSDTDFDNRSATEFSDVYNDTLYSVDPVTDTAEPLNDSNIPALANRKIIYKANILLVVDDLEALKTTLSSLITTYVAYYDEYEETKSKLIINLRVPSENYHNFIDDISAVGEVASIGQSAEDITNSYSTFEARKEALEAQYAAVQALLTDAVDLSDVLTLREELANIESQLNSIGKTLDNYDDLVDYSSITLTVTKLDDLSELLEKSSEPNVRVTETSKSGMIVKVENTSIEEGTIYLNLINNGELIKSYNEEVYGNGSFEFVIKDLESGTQYTLEATFLESNHRLSTIDSTYETTNFTFGSRIAITFETSLKSLVVVFEWTGIIITAVLPYGIVIAVFYVPFNYAFKTVIKPRREKRKIKNELLKKEQRKKIKELQEKE